MIHYQPFHLPGHTGTIAAFRKNLVADFEKKVCDRLNTKATNQLDCERHALPATVILKFDKETNQFQFNGVDWCCDDFKKAALDAINQCILK